MTVLLVFSVVLLVAGSFLVGYGQGKRSRKIDLSGLGAQEAFAYFLEHEVFRHLKDVERTKRDIATLRRNGIVAPKLPVGLWINVVPKQGPNAPGKGME